MQSAEWENVKHPEARESNNGVQGGDIFHPGVRARHECGDQGKERGASEYQSGGVQNVPTDCCRRAVLC